MPTPPAPGAILGSFAALVDQLIAAHVRLMSSYLRIGSPVAGRSRAAAASATTRPRDGRPASTRAPSDPVPTPATDSIEARAYEIFVSRGREPGNPVDDWRRAEAELRGELPG